MGKSMLSTKIRIDEFQAIAVGKVRLGIRAWIDKTAIVLNDTDYRIYYSLL